MEKPNVAGSPVVIPLDVIVRQPKEWKQQLKGLTPLFFFSASFGGRFFLCSWASFGAPVILGVHSGDTGGLMRDLAIQACHGGRWDKDHAA